MPVQAQRTVHGLLLTCTGCGARFVPLYQQDADAFVAQHAACPTHYGLGDLVAMVAKPVARAIGYDPNCRPCAERQAALNQRVPRLWRR